MSQFAAMVVLLIIWILIGYWYKRGKPFLARAKVTLPSPK